MNLENAVAVDNGSFEFKAGLSDIFSSDKGPSIVSDYQLPEPDNLHALSAATTWNLERLRSSYATWQKLGVAKLALAKRRSLRAQSER